jgi:O-succinylbenzoic acid--CoA ligase
MVTTSWLSNNAMNVEDCTIQFGSTAYTLGDLLKQEVVSFTPFEKSVIDLCRRWVSGETHFEVSTSGSTGIAKQITFHRDQLLASAMSTGNALGLKQGMKALLCLDPQFIAGKMMVVRSLVIGMDLVVITPVANPLDHIPDNIASIDFAAMVPLQVITSLNSSHAADIDKFRVIIIGGGQVDSTLRTRLQNIRASCYASFGMTETITHVALQKLNGHDQSEYMQALPGIALSTDDRGCLVIKAPFLQESVVTSDVVDLIDRQNFRWLGRWDNVINTGGVKIIPENVEPHIATLLNESGVDNQFFIHGAAHPALGHELVLVIEGSIESSQEALILQRLKKQLPKYSSPRRVLYAEKFSYTPTGKIKRTESAENASPRPGSPD